MCVRGFFFCKKRRQENGTPKTSAPERMTNEPNDFVSVLFNENKETEINILSANQGSTESIYDEERTVNVLKKYHKEYSKVEGQ